MYAITTITAIIAVIIDKKTNQAMWAAAHLHQLLVLYAAFMKKLRLSVVFISASALFSAISLATGEVPKMILSVCAMICSICALITVIKGAV